jgi:hypothetical protein
MLMIERAAYHPVTNNARATGSLSEQLSIGSQRNVRNDQVRCVMNCDFAVSAHCRALECALPGLHLGFDPAPGLHAQLLALQRLVLGVDALTSSAVSLGRISASISISRDARS